MHYGYHWKPGTVLLAFVWCLVALLVCAFFQQNVLHKMKREKYNKYLSIGNKDSVEILRVYAMQGIAMTS